MSTCADCEWWTKGLRYPRDGADEAHLTQTGICENEEAFPRFHRPELGPIRLSTWHDFPACRYFKPRQDWAERAAERVRAASLETTYTYEGWNKTCAAIIREEAAKAAFNDVSATHPVSRGEK